MGLFKKEFCDICGNKIGLLGKRRLSDGLLCKNCAAQLSPWFQERRHSTLAEIRSQLIYREANKDAVRRFTVTRSIGGYTRLLIDDRARKFTVAGGSDPLSGNPDILSFDQAASCDLQVDPFRTEKKQTVDGKKVSYQPPRYEYSYTLYAVIRVSGNPYFDEMKINIGNGPVSTGELSMESMGMSSGWTLCGSLGTELSPGVEKFRKYLGYGNQMKQAIEDMRIQPAAAAGLYVQTEDAAQEAAAPDHTSSPAPQSFPSSDAESYTSDPELSAAAAGSCTSGAEIPAASADPSSDAAPKKKWFCPECGTPNEGKYCINCGTRHPWL